MPDIPPLVSDNLIQPSEQQSIDSQKLKSIEESLSMSDFTEIGSDKSLEDLHNLYAQLPSLSKEMSIESVYLQVLQHNLIVSMVMNYDLLENPVHHQKAVLYAKEFARLGADHLQVANAFYHKFGKDLSSQELTSFYSKAKNTDMKEYEEVKLAIRNLNETK